MLADIPSDQHTKRQSKEKEHRLVTPVLLYERHDDCSSVDLLGVSHHRCTHPHHLFLSEQIQRLHMFVHTSRLGHYWSALFRTGTHVECALIREDTRVRPAWWDQVSHRRGRVVECAYKKSRVTVAQSWAPSGEIEDRLRLRPRSPFCTNRSFPF